MIALKSLVNKGLRSLRKVNILDLKIMRRK